LSAADVCVPPRLRDDLGGMLRLVRWLARLKRGTVGGYCVLRFPDSTESRWFDQVPTPGTRIYSHHGHFYWGQVWVVDEVLQSGRDTYTVFCVTRREYLDHLRHRASGKPDLASELLELARHASETVTERRRRWKYRNSQP
jgi:hypothetical protein